MQWKPNSWDSCWYKRKEVFSGATWFGRMAVSDLKDHPFFLLNPMVLTGIGRGGLFSPYPLILLAFGKLKSFPLIFLVFSMFSPYPFIFLTFGMLSISFPCAILSNEGDSLVLQMTVSSNSIKRADTDQCNRTETPENRPTQIYPTPFCQSCKCSLME